MVKSLVPSKGMISVVKAMFKDAWAQRLNQTQNMKPEIKPGIVMLDKQLDGLLDRILDTDNPTVIAAYEKRIAKADLELRKPPKS